MNRHIQQFMRTKTQGEQNRTVRSIRSTTNYNLSDFLPPPREVTQSHIAPLAHKVNKKITTEPYEKIKESTVNELNRKNELLEQENKNLKEELQRITIEVGQHRKAKEDQQIQNKRLRQQLQEQEMARKPKVYLDRGTTQFQLFPKYRQTYQVSVQTEQEYTSSLPSQPKESKTIGFSSDSQMQQIYQKLQNLKMPKRKVELPTHPLSSLKTDRVRGMTPCWGSNDKENIMRRSNIMDKLSYPQSQERVKNQTLDLYCMPLEKGERLLAQYLEEPLI